MAYRRYRLFFSDVLKLSKSLPLFAMTIMMVSSNHVHAATKTIVAFGDSLMAGYQLPAGDGFTDRLQEKLHQQDFDVTVINAAVSGDTTSGGLSRLDWSIPDGTDLVLLELGANDMLRGLTPELTQSNLEQMIMRLKQRSIDILLVGMVAAPNLGPDYEAKFNSIYPQLAQEYDLPLVPFFLEGVVTNPELLLEDRMHPNSKGVDIMVNTVLPVLEPMLRRAVKD